MRRRIPLAVSFDDTPCRRCCLLIPPSPTIRAALDRRRAAVLTAAPGAGKTTRVPPALVDRGRVLLLQPRRVAARAMARRIADERGWTIGREIGWHIRFERQFTGDTRLLVVTEGILTAYLQQDPLLSDVTTLVVDEFHERSVHADLGLALAKQAWLARPDLRIVVMSATLDTAPVAAFLGGCPDHRRARHAASVDDRLRAPANRSRTRLDELLPRTPRQCAVFPAGRARDRSGDRARATPSRVARRRARAAARLARCARAGCARCLTSRACRADARSAKAGDRGDQHRRDLADGPGVSVVIDCGLQKVARYDADRGVDSLTTERDHARQRRSARRPRGAARARHRAPIVGRARSPARRIAKRRSIASISRRRCCRSSRWGRRAGRLRMVRRAGRRSHRPAMSLLARLARSKTGRSRRSAARCSACRCTRGWRAC